MAKFLTGNKLNSELGQLLEEAEENIILISPFIKLHNRYASILETKKNNPKLKIIIVFGKNEEDLSKSMKKDDFEFFKKFPNIQIRYEKLLHAKYYANESSAILTSMNLYSYSHDNNIEAGVMTKATLLSVIKDESLDNQASEYFERVIEQSELLFHKVPIFDKGMLRTGLSKKYRESKIEVDKLTDFFTNRVKYDTVKKEKKIIKKKKVNEVSNKGYCIRTGKKIPFNIEKPLSYEAYMEWKKFNDPDYPEKFCHFSGEPSNGKTSVSKPILKKNWKKAKDIFNL